MTDETSELNPPTDVFAWELHPRRLNLGCGWDKRDGFLNIDLHGFHEPDLVADVRNLDMLPSGQYDEIVAQDVLEHLTRADGPVALREWARLLRIGGQLVLRLPDLIGLLDTLRASDDPAHQTNMVQCLFGTQAYNGDFHLNGFTEALLRHALHDAGFDVESLVGRDGWLFDVVARRVNVPAPVTGSATPDVRTLDAPAASPQLTSRFGGHNLDAGPIDTSSRLPGGGRVHEIMDRLMRRRLTAVYVRFGDFRDSLVEELAEFDRRLTQVEARVDDRSSDRL